MLQVLPRFAIFSQNAFMMFLAVMFLGGGTAIIAQTQPTATATTAQSSAAATKPNADSPTNTVQEFYKAMREKRFRDALMMTNLRPAVEKLTAAEMTDLTPDFEPMAARVPANVELSGEQISGSLASVFVKANDPLTNELKLDELKLRRENEAWLVLTGDAATEAEARREGGGYFFKLRLETRHADIELTMQDIIKAELGYSVLHNGEYADLPALVKDNLLSPEVLNADLMGYRFRAQISGDKKKYAVNAEPLQYGKTGKLSFLLTSGDAKNGPRIQKDDKNGAALASKN